MIVSYMLQYLDKTTLGNAAIMGIIKDTVGCLFTRLGPGGIPRLTNPTVFSDQGLTSKAMIAPGGPGLFVGLEHFLLWLSGG